MDLSSKKANTKQTTILNLLKDTSSSRQPCYKKRGVSRQWTFCLLFLVLSFSTTSVALAFIDLGSTRRVIDIVGRVTKDKDVKSINRSLSNIDGYLRQSQEFYRNISRKNIPGIIRQIESILGKLGIISPRSYPRSIEDILNGSVLSTSIPTTPAQIYIGQRIVTDTANSGSFWIYTDSVLGNDAQAGQSRLQAMERISLASTEASIKGEELSASQSQQSLQNTQLVRNASASVERLSKQAQQRKVSQDVFKDVAAQQSYLAKSNSAIANQLAALSQQSAIAASQTSALVTQSQVSNEHLTQMRVGQSIGNIQLHDIFNAQRHANEMDAMESQKNTQISIGSLDAIYIPSLYTKQATSN